MFLVGALVLLLGFGGIALARWSRRGFTAGASGPVPQGAYVWQRQWTEPVRDTVRGAAAPGENGETPSTLLVFCAEISPPAGEGGGAPAGVFRVGELDLPLLAGLARPVGLVVRARALPGEVGPEREPFPTVRRVLDELLGKCAAAGLRPAEVQLDFDCPPGKLPGYTAALAALRGAYPAQKLVPTALPAWLGTEHFAAWAKSAGEFVLQFAGTERLGGGPDRHPPLTRCNPTEVVAAVARAARAGVPFRVALPTDGFRLVLDADGRLVAAVPEGPLLERRRPPAGGSVRLLLSDAGDLARLIEEWTDRRPAALRGVLWHRLPVAGERLNWPAPTLRAVAAGRVPRPKISWQLSGPDGGGQRELSLHNVGEAVAILPPALTVNSPVDPLAVAPAAPYELAPPDPKRPPHALLFRRRGGEDVESLRVRLPPGEGFTVATLRLSEDAPEPPPGEEEIVAELDTDATPAPSPAPAGSP